MTSSNYISAPNDISKITQNEFPKTESQQIHKELYFLIQYSNQNLCKTENNQKLLKRLATT